MMGSMEPPKLMLKETLTNKSKLTCQFEIRVTSQSCFGPVFKVNGFHGTHQTPANGDPYK